MVEFPVGVIFSWNLNLLLFFCECNLTLSFLFVQEVGSIIGKKGEIVKKFREEVRITDLT